MKRTLCMVLTAILLLSAFCACGKTEGQNDSAEKDFEYVISEEKDRVIITKYVGSDENVVIPSKIEDLPVFTIKGYETENGGKTVGAFEGTNVKSVVIPDSVRVIIDSFADCKALEKVVFGENSEIVMLSGAFKNCVSLEKIDLSMTELVDIDASCFEGCTALKEVIFSDTVKSIDKRAFRECRALEEIVLPENLEYLGGSAFENCTALKKVTIPAKLDMKSCGDTPAFHGLDSLEQMIFESGRDEISSCSFAVIDTDAEIIIPDSVKSFSNRSFTFKKSARLVFMGDCPEILDAETALGEESPTVYYDPATKGWEDCIWREDHKVLPKE